MPEKLPPHRWWGHPIITHGERFIIAKALADMEAQLVAKGPPECCPDHAEGYEIRLDKVRALITRFSKP